MLDQNDLLPEEQSNPALIQELQTTYRMRPEEQQALARVHERLAHSSHPLPPIDTVRIDDLSRSRLSATPFAFPARNAGSRRRWLTRLSALAAAIIIALLVGSLALTFSLINHTRVGSPAGNDLRVLLEPTKGSNPSRAEMQATSEILSQRFGNFGLTGASTQVVTLNGQFAIQMELPHFGGNEERQSTAILVETGKLEFWCTGPFPLQIGATFDPTQFYASYNPGNQPRFTGKDLDPNQLYVSHDQAGRPQINFEMQGDAIAGFGVFTADNIGQYLTITFDRKVIESAVIQSAITGPGVITGNFTEQQANAIVADLKAGSLPVALTVAG
jgi:preprotein translocase subunit SecD